MAQRQRRLHGVFLHEHGPRERQHRQHEQQRRERAQQERPAVAARIFRRLGRAARGGDDPPARREQLKDRGAERRDQQQKPDDAAAAEVELADDAAVHDGGERLDLAANGERDAVVRDGEGEDKKRRGEQLLAQKR